jgi:hypothetical protein
MTARAFAQLIAEEVAQPGKRAILRHLEAGHGVDDVDVVHPYGTLLHVAVASGSTKSAKILLDAGINN